MRVWCCFVNTEHCRDLVELLAIVVGQQTTEQTWLVSKARTIFSLLIIAVAGNHGERIAMP